MNLGKVMDIQISGWILSGAFFLFGAIIVGGLVWYFAVKKMQSLVSDNNDNKRWEFGNVQGMLAVIIVLSFIGVVYALIFKPPSLDDQSKDTLLIVLGALVGQFVVICSFYYGSTVQNKAKDESARLTAEAAATAATAQATTAKTMERVVTGTGNGTVLPIAPIATQTTTTATEVTKPPVKPDDPIVTKTTSESVTVPAEPPKGGTG